MTLYDSSNNKLVNGGDTVSAVLLDSGLNQVGVIDVKDLKDGSYLVEYYVNTLSGIYTCEVVVNGDIANKKTTTITIVPDAPHALSSTIAHPSLITIGTSSLIDILIKDRWGNNYIEVVTDILYKVTGNHKTLYGKVDVLNQAAATYQTSITIPTSTEVNDTTCGPIEISAYLLKHGIEAKYYSNRWFSGRPALVQTDSQINFNWDSNEIIPGVSSDYTSIEWSGYLRPLYSELYTFYS